MAERPTHTPFPARLKALRKARQLTQEAIAEAAGVTHGTISRLERGLFAPSHSLLVRLAPALGVSVAELLSDAPEAAIMDVWDRIEPIRRAQALRVLEAFAEPFLHDEGPPAAAKRKRKRT
jgi:transcriptional regulator with XRE-family HTH domain